MTHTTILRDALEDCLSSLTYMDRHFSVVDCTEEIDKARAALAAADADQAPELEINERRDTHYIAAAEEAGVFCTTSQAMAFGRKCLEWERVGIADVQRQFEIMRDLHESSQRQHANMLRLLDHAARPAPVGAVQAPVVQTMQRVFFPDGRASVSALQRTSRLPWNSARDFLQALNDAGWLAGLEISPHIEQAAAPAAPIVEHASSNSPEIEGIAEHAKPEPVIRYENTDVGFVMKFDAPTVPAIPRTSAKACQQAGAVYGIAFDRRWSLARDGFGVERNDEIGEYVTHTDAVAVLHAAIAAANQKGE